MSWLTDNVQGSRKKSNFVVLLSITILSLQGQPKLILHKIST